MLLSLSVKNFALMDHLEMNVEPGMNILTGETGAGKSILIDAISHVMGGKFTREFIRTGEDSAYVEAVFSMTESARPLLAEWGIQEEDVLILSRESFSNGRTTGRINGKAVLISSLREMGKTLLDIHGQHINQNLLDERMHRHYLDDFIDLGSTAEKTSYDAAYAAYQDTAQRLSKLKGSKDRAKLLDYLKFQMDDIARGNLQDAEEQELQEKVRMLTHAEKISQGLHDAHASLSAEGGALAQMSHAMRALTAVRKVYEKVGAPLGVLEEAYFLLEDAAQELGQEKERVYYDQDELNFVNERLYQYSGYKKKYGPEVSDVLEYFAKISKEYDEIQNAESIILELEAELLKLREELRRRGAALMELRGKGGESLAKTINKELKFVGLEKARFKVSVAEAEISEEGTDAIRFLISTNLGEPHKPLEKIVSGGELSRIMLAMKVAFIHKDGIPTVIFDEIDTGISGRIAEAVGEKMFVLSRGCQVFCVTHLPQIAAFAEHHLEVMKQEEANRTRTQLRMLEDEDKVMALAKMVGGRQISDATLANARDILEKTRKIKEKHRSQS